MGEGEPLTGDGVTQGIVRIGDTVRRPLRPFSLTVQAYLAHLRDAGFGGVAARGRPGHRRPPQPAGLGKAAARYVRHFSPSGG
jgi:hypothetical protein